MVRSSVTTCSTCRADCDASPADPEIYVYENKTTRVCNDLTDIEFGQMDIFVRDEETDLPLNDARGLSSTTGRSTTAAIRGFRLHADANMDGKV